VKKTHARVAGYNWWVADDAGIQQQLLFMLCVHHHHHVLLCLHVIAGMGVLHLGKRKQPCLSHRHTGREAAASPLTGSVTAAQVLLRVLSQRCRPGSTTKCAE
jgi:hypothetical protein